MQNIAEYFTKQSIDDQEKDRDAKCFTELTRKQNLVCSKPVLELGL